MPLCLALVRCPALPHPPISGVLQGPLGVCCLGHSGRTSVSCPSWLRDMCPVLVARSSGRRVTWHGHQPWEVVRRHRGSPLLLPPPNSLGDPARLLASLLQCGHSLLSVRTVLSDVAVSSLTLSSWSLMAYRDVLALPGEVKAPSSQPWGMKPWLQSRHMIRRDSAFSLWLLPS